MATAVALAPAFATAQIIESPITRAMMGVYDQIIDENPRDYETLLHRANEYYNHNLYRQALDDVNNALRYLPAEDTELRFQAIFLRGNIYNQMKRYGEALTDLNEALTLNPQSYPAMFQRAAAEYELGQLDKAQTDYAMILREHPRNQDAMFGLARIAVRNSNLGVANDYADRAVELSPGISEVYMERAAVRRLAGNMQGAVDDYIVAMSTDQESTPQALHGLVTLSNSHYATVMSGLTNAIRKAPRNGMFYYIRAMIAQGHCNYAAAIADYDKIINDKLYSYSGLNASLGECYYALGKYDTALLNADYAIKGAPENASYHVLKSMILRAMGEGEQSLAEAETALAMNPDLNEALEAKALACVTLGKYQEASVAFSEAVLNDPTDPYLLMLRAWVAEQYRNQPEVAKTCYEQTIELEFDFDQIRSYRGFALLYLGRTDEADRWMERILEHAEDTDGLISYYATCFYAAKGSRDLAFRYMEKSLEKGYANYHNWMENSDARVNVAPLRDDARFKELMTRYAALFK